MFANIPLSFFNISFQERPAFGESELRRLCSTMLLRARACSHPSLICICDEWVPKNWRVIAKEEGFAFALNMTGMAADRLLPARRPLPELEYRRVQDGATARDLAMINAQAYGMPAEMWESICNMQLWLPDSFAYVGYRDGTAVSAAAALPVEGAMYIALVATLPREHAKGYAEAVMRQVIGQAQAEMGTRRVVLHASDMGQPLYRSMGFFSGCQVPLLSPML